MSPTRPLAIIAAVTLAAPSLLVDADIASIEPLLNVRDTQLVNCPWDSFESQVIYRFDNGTVILVLDIQHSINDGDKWIHASETSGGVNLAEIDAESVWRDDVLNGFQPALNSTEKLDQWVQHHTEQYGSFMNLVSSDYSQVYRATNVTYTNMYHTPVSENTNIIRPEVPRWDSDYIFSSPSPYYDLAKLQRNRAVKLNDTSVPSPDGLQNGVNNLRLVVRFDTGEVGTGLDEEAFYFFPGAFSVDTHEFESAWKSTLHSNGQFEYDMAAVPEVYHHIMPNLNNGTSGAAPLCPGGPFHENMYYHGLPESEAGFVDDGIIRNNYTVPFIRADGSHPMDVPVLNEKYVFDPITNQLKIDWAIDPANFGTYTLNGRIRALVEGEDSGQEDIWYDVDVEYFSVRVGDVVAALDMEVLAATPPVYRTHVSQSATGQYMTGATYDYTNTDSIQCAAGSLRDELFGPWKANVNHYFIEVADGYRYELLAPVEGQAIQYTSPFAASLGVKDMYEQVAINSATQIGPASVVFSSMNADADQIVPSLEDSLAAQSRSVSSLLVARKVHANTGVPVDSTQLLFTDREFLELADACGGILYIPSSASETCDTPVDHCMKNTISGLQASPEAYKPFGKVELAGGYENKWGEVHARAEMDDKTGKLVLHHPRHLGRFDDKVLNADGTIKFTIPSHVINMKAVVDGVRIEEPVLSIAAPRQLEFIRHADGQKDDQAYVLFTVQNTGKADGVVDVKLTCDTLYPAQVVVHSEHMTDMIKPGASVEFGFNLRLAKPVGRNINKWDMDALNCQFEGTVRSKPLWVQDGKVVTETLALKVTDSHLYSASEEATEGLCKYMVAPTDDIVHAEIVSLSAPSGTMYADGLRTTPKTLSWNTDGNTTEVLIGDPVSPHALSYHGYSRSDWKTLGGYYSTFYWADPWNQHLDFAGVDEMYMGKVLADGVVMISIDADADGHSATDTDGGLEVIKVEQHCDAVDNRDGAEDGLKFGVIEVVWNTRDSRMDAVPQLSLGKGSRQALNFQLVHMGAYSPGAPPGQDNDLSRYDLKGKKCYITIKAKSGDTMCNHWSVREVISFDPFGLKTKGTSKVNVSAVTLSATLNGISESEDMTPDAAMSASEMLTHTLASSAVNNGALYWNQLSQSRPCPDHVVGCASECSVLSDECAQCEPGFAAVVPGRCQKCEATYGMGCTTCDAHICTSWKNCVLDSGFCRENLVHRYAVKDRHGNSINEVLSDGDIFTCAPVDAINTGIRFNSTSVSPTSTWGTRKQNTHFRKNGGRFNGFADYLSGVVGPAHGNRKLDWNAYVMRDNQYVDTPWAIMDAYTIPTFWGITIYPNYPNWISPQKNQYADKPRTWMAGRIAAEAFFNGRVDYGLVDTADPVYATNNYLDVSLGEVVVLDKVQSSGLNIRMQAAEWAYTPNTVHRDQHVCRKASDFTTFTQNVDNKLLSLPEKYAQVHALNKCAYCPNNQQMKMGMARGRPYASSTVTLHHMPQDCVQEDVEGMMAQGSNFGSKNAGSIDECIAEYGVTQPFGSTLRLDYANINPDYYLNDIEYWGLPWEGTGLGRNTLPAGAKETIYFEKLLKPFCDLVMLEVL
ncbi:hypothetical protein SARC_04118 [Sphaeroforma arctica JP610]|uniref:TNFR-Cys domain-containing protein n=1 Tax=Sphaeroforma arctica JP610 TaxID=667725 RepID=A0A0L0G5X8_9EUKA|nr:hypothetical protein SARC_04118 [Sphaeroforma arctica JP610]KNC83618.1 hypothetical protein SARC_04118 [Sphaeroforma arctica JP610]|eukprot:XP_014157520.1 hypothetical protein SARC_04118 [Sphaeroforma arctica JP610]